jgi:adenylate cyclase
VTVLFADAVHSMDIFEALLDRGAEVDVVEADGVISRLEAAPAEGSVIRDIWVLRLRALLARARGDETGYREHRDRYRALATSLGFEGHMAWAEAMS